MAGTVTNGKREPTVSENIPPRYPAENGPAHGQDRLGDRAPTPWKTYLLVGAGIGLVLLFIGLHLAGVLGPGGH